MFKNLIIKTLFAIASSLMLFTKKQVRIQHKRNRNAIVLTNLLVSTRFC